MSSGHGAHKPRKENHPNRQVGPERYRNANSIPLGEILGGRFVYGESNAWSGLRQAEEDAQDATQYSPSEYDDYDYG